MYARMATTNIAIKDCSACKSGTWKDYRSIYIAQLIANSAYKNVVIITSGNAGYSLGLLLKGTDIKLYCIVEDTIQESIKQKLETVSTVICTDLRERFLNTEALEKLCDLSKSTCFNATEAFPDAYINLLINDEALMYDYIICPVGSAEAFLGISKKLEESNSKTKLIGVTAEAATSIANKLTTPWRPLAEQVERVIESERGELLYIPEERVVAAYEANKHLQAEPSATIVWAAVEELPEGAKILVINSGLGLV